MKKAWYSSISIYIGKIAQFIFSFLTSIYVIRYLSTAEFGAYKLIHTILLFSTYFTSLGLENALGRYLPEFLSKREYQKVNKLLEITVFLRIAAIGLLIGLLVSFRNSIFSFFHFPAILVKLFPCICILIFLNRIKSLFGTQLLAAYVEHYWDNLNKVGAVILRFTLFLLVIKKNWGLTGLILSMLIVDTLSFFYYLYFAVRKYTENLRLSKNLPQSQSINLRRISRFAAFSYLSTSSDVFKEILIDNFVISHFLNIAAVGVYSFAAAIIEIPRSLNPANLLRSVIMPVLVKKYYQAGENNSVLRFSYELMNKVYFLVAFPLYLTVGLFAREIILYVFAEKYLPALPVIYIFVPAYIIGDMVYVFRPIVNIIEKTEIFFFSGVFSMYNLVMDIVLVRSFGIMGVAIATGSTVVLQYWYFLFAVNRFSKCNFPFPLKILIKAMGNFAPAFILGVFYKRLITNIISLAIGVLLVLLIYLLFCHLNPFFDKEERCFINSIVGRKVCVF